LKKKIENDNYLKPLSVSFWEIICDHEPGAAQRSTKRSADWKILNSSSI